MRCSLLAIVFGTLAAGGMSLAHHDEHGKGGAQVKLLSQKDIIEKVDEKKAKATMLEVTLAPGAVEAAHRHPGPAFGYILDGEYEWAIDDNKPKIFKAGDTFYEPTGCLHRVHFRSSRPSRLDMRVRTVGRPVRSVHALTGNPATGDATRAATFGRPLACWELRGKPCA